MINSNIAIAIMLKAEAMEVRMVTKVVAAAGKDRMILAVVVVEDVVCVSP